MERSASSVSRVRPTMDLLPSHRLVPGQEAPVRAARSRCGAARRCARGAPRAARRRRRPPRDPRRRAARRPALPPDQVAGRVDRHHLPLDHRALAPRSAERLRQRLPGADVAPSEETPAGTRPVDCARARRGRSTARALGGRPARGLDPAGAPSPGRGAERRSSGAWASISSRIARAVQTKMPAFQRYSPLRR